jgi:hypothetical protein
LLSGNWKHSGKELIKMPGGEIRQSESGKDGDQRKKTRPGEQLKKGGLNSLQGSIKAHEYQKEILKRGIGSENPAASKSAYWAEKMGEASSAKDASSAQIKQLQLEKLALIKGLPEQKNESTSKRRSRQLLMNERKIQLEKLKKRNAILREESFKIVSEAAKIIELKR